MKAKRNYYLLAAFTLLVEMLGLTGPQFVLTTSAATLPIISYDVEQTPRSGWGCWFHAYSGTITNTGRTVSGSVVCTSDGNQIANYSGGSGTLNDGIISSSNDTHLFTTRSADDGSPVAPVITLHLGGTYLIDRISLFGGDIGANVIPGAITGVTVEIGGSSIALATTPFGDLNAIGVPVNDLIDLTTTPLAGIPTDQVVLRDFTASVFGSLFDQFSLSEIIVDGAPPPTLAEERNPGVLPPHSQAFGKTYAEWSAAWWQYVLSFPAATNPLFDETGATCTAGQGEKIFFLVGSFTGPVVRDNCIVPSGSALFLPMVNIVDVNVDSQTADELRAEIAPIEDAAHDLHAIVDGVSVGNLVAFRTKSTVFSLTLPADNLFGLPQGTYAPAVADGYYLLLAPLPPGPHIIVFGGIDGSGFSQDITYHLMVQPPHQ